MTRKVEIYIVKRMTVPDKLILHFIATVIRHRFVHFRLSIDSRTFYDENRSSKVRLRPKPDHLTSFIGYYLVYKVCSV